MNLVFLGPPGVGKGTQAKLLAQKLSIPHISTGDMLRAEMASKSELGIKVSQIVESGQLVSDELITEIVSSRLSNQDVKNGFILDGYPRTTTQAEALLGISEQKNLELSAVVLFEADQDDVLSRLRTRRNQEGREDDNEEIILERLKVYKEQTKPLVDFYESKSLLKRVDSKGSIEDVFTNLVKELGI